MLFFTLLVLLCVTPVEDRPQVNDAIERRTDNAIFTGMDGQPIATSSPAQWSTALVALPGDSDQLLVA